jgi:hypothetical protein
MILPRLDLLVWAGFFFGPYLGDTVGSYRRFGTGNLGSVSLGVLELTFSGNGNMP